MRNYDTHPSPGPGRTGSRSERAFTLIELVITVALVAILAAISVPALTQTMERLDAQSTARSVANVFRQARSQAMSRGEVVLVRINRGTQTTTFSLNRTDNNHLRCANVASSPGSTTTQVGTPVPVNELSGKMVVASTEPSNTDWVCFAPDGTMRKAGGGLLEQSNCPGTSFRVWFKRRGASVQDAANTVGVSKDDLTGCPSNPPSRTKVRSGRMLAHIYLLDVPFNGAVRVYQ